MKKTVIAAAAIILAASCNNEVKLPLLSAENFQTEIDGKKTDLYTIKNGDVTVQFTNFGARIVSIFTPDRNGEFGDICPGYDNLEMYVHNPGERFLGAIVGPVANRIGKGVFTLDGVTYNTPLNNDGNTLHGGFTGVDMLVWDLESLTDSSAVLSVTHPDGFEGWPGNKTIRVYYTVTSSNSLDVKFEATTDKATPINLSCHAFFNLTGNTGKSILDHVLQINASRTTPVDKLLIPTGEIVSLDGSPLDFRQPKAIGKDLYADDIQLGNGNGYDHNWCLDRQTENEMEKAASISDPESGRTLEVYTDQPGIQFYCGNFFTGNELDKYGNPIGYRCAFVFETQKWPDAINHEGFTDTVLRPGEKYTHNCSYRFGTK